MSGKGHPLPRSDEARHNEIPEHLEKEKGCGDDPQSGIQPAGDAVAPDGERYRYDAAPVSGARRGSADAADDDLDEDQAAHQDRGQSVAEEEADRG